MLRNHFTPYRVGAIDTRSPKDVLGFVEQKGREIEEAKRRCVSSRRFQEMGRAAV
jgi:hypothetical protein